MTAIQAQQIDKCLDVLSVAKAGGEYLPVTISQEISDVLHRPTAGIGKWSHVARAIVDQGKAMALYATLFPDDEWSLHRLVADDGRPFFLLNVYDDDGSTEPLISIEHGVCAIAIVMAALERRRPA